MLHYVALDMGNLQSVHPTFDNEAQQALNETKQKEIQFNKEVCQEAS